MDQFLSFLNAKRAKVQKQLQRAQDELAELDKAERLYKASGAAPTAEQTTIFSITAPTRQTGSETKWVSTSTEVSTIKQHVLAVLSKNPEGLTSGQILNVLRISGLPSLARESLSPQLSRLKKEKQIEAQHGLWRLQKRESQGA